MVKIVMDLKLPIIIQKKQKWYIASCPVLDVVTQGETKKRAKENLFDALYLFLTSCFERGTLDNVFKECGFHPVEKKQTLESVDYISIPLHLLSEKDGLKPCHA